MMLCSKDSSKGSWSAGRMLVPFPTTIGFDLKRLWSDDLHLISISFDFMLEMEEDSQSEYKAHCSLQGPNRFDVNVPSVASLRDWI